MAVTLRQLLATVGEPLVELLVAPHGLGTAVGEVVIVDPDDDHGPGPGMLVLVIGARGRDALRVLRAVARRGAAAVAVKTGQGAAAELRAAAADAGIALLAVREDVGWDQLARLLRGVVDGGPDAAGEEPGGDDPGELFTLAQTTAWLANGLVTIEDTASRVLAYSRSADDRLGDADELRRLSILGWQGPPDYLRRLRAWGVFDRLRAGEEVVRVEEHPELGIRARLAVGIHAGSRQLGTIWAQEGTTPFTDRAATVLLGAARVAAGQLIRHRSRQAAGARWTRDLVAGLLGGRADPRLVAETFDLAIDGPVVVAGFAVDATAGSAHALGLAELAGAVSVHAATYRRDALTGRDAGTVYAVLPGVPLDRAEPALLAMCAEVAALTLRRGGVRVLAGIGSAVPSLADAHRSRAEADRVLAAMPATAQVAAIGDLRAVILLDRTLRLIAENPDLRDPAVARLLAHDAERGTELAGSVLAYLDAMGDVRTAAERLTVHPNTLRYRLRRAAAVAGLDLGDPEARLMHHLHLLIARRPDLQRTGLNPVRPD